MHKGKRRTDSRKATGRQHIQVNGTLRRMIWIYAKRAQKWELKTASTAHSGIPVWDVKITTLRMILANRMEGAEVKADDE